MEQLVFVTNFQECKRLIGLKRSVFDLNFSCGDYEGYCLLGCDSIILVDSYQYLGRKCCILYPVIGSSRFFFSRLLGTVYHSTQHYIKKIVTLKNSILIAYSYVL
jgi:hypothetical protein